MVSFIGFVLVTGGNRSKLWYYIAFVGGFLAFKKLKNGAGNLWPSWEPPSFF